MSLRRSSNSPGLPGRCHRRIELWRLIERLGGRRTPAVYDCASQLVNLEVDARFTQRLKLLLQVVGDSISNVPFYSCVDSTGNEEPLAQFHCLPVVTKDDLRLDSKRLVSRTIQGKPGKSVSGGSTGVPVTCYTDPEAPSLVKAAMIEGRSWWGIQPRSRCLSLWGHSKYLNGDWRSRLKLRRQRVRDALANRRVIPAYDLSPETALLFNRYWIQDKPQYIIGYASALYEMARLHEELGLDVPADKCVVMSTGEVLQDWQADEIERVFGCKVFEEYGLVECGAVAYTEPVEPGLRVIDSHFLVELINDCGDHVRCGEEGRIVVSSLRRLDVPVLRYDTGDRAVCLDPDGGFDCRRISKVIGRTYDMIRDEDGRAIAGVIFTHALKPLNGIRRFEVVQCRYGSVDIRYTSDDDVESSILESARHAAGNRATV